MSSQTSPLEAHRKAIESFYAQGKSPAEISERLPLKTSDRSVRRALRRWGLVYEGDPASTFIDGDKGEISTGVQDAREWKNPLNDTETLLRERGLDPEDWEVISATVNEWDSATTPGITLKQLKLYIRRRKPLFTVVPARVELGRIHTPGLWTPSDHALTNRRLIVFVGDQQAPYHNTHLHELFVEWLGVNTPDEGVLIGDTIDLPVISRHPDEPEWAATTQECLDAAGQILLDYVQASEPTGWKKLGGNHDERLRRAIINQLGDYYGLKPAQIENLPDLPPIHDPVHLLRLDELGIEYVRAKGSYDHASVKLSPYLAARHGWIARKGSGSSALATLQHLGHSIVVGHTHRQSQVHETKFDIDGNATTLAAVETGCMCRIEEGLGYTVAPDWQNGFATATIWPDGRFKLDLATYVNGNLFWRDQRYS